jgi:hypothetical protein
LQYIHGSATELDGVNQVSVGPVGNIFATNTNSSTSSDVSPVSKFLAGANGNSAPIDQVFVDNYILLSVVIDPSGDIITGGQTMSAPYSAIYYFPSTASGYATPTKVIKGLATEIGNPYNLAIDSSGYLYEPQKVYSITTTFAAIKVYSPSASGNTPPTRTITGSNTKLVTPNQVWIDNSTYGAGRIIVADEAGNVLVFSPGASGNATPVQDITSISGPDGVATDSTGKIYVSAPNGNQIRIFAKDATGNATPLNKIGGSATHLQSPGQLFIAPYSGSS